MAYFSNGTEGMDYRAQWCERCVHQPQEPAADNACAVWLAHLLWNGDRDQQCVLDALIPRSADKLTNEQCLMFLERISWPTTPPAIGAARKTPSWCQPGNR